jgi:hypothetical protein
MNTKILTLIATLSLFAANTTTTNHTNTKQANVVDLTELLCRECESAEKEGNSEKMISCETLRRADGSFINKLVEMGPCPYAKEQTKKMSTALETIIKDLSPEEKEACLKQHDSATQQLYIMHTFGPHEFHISNQTNIGNHNEY